MDDDADKPKMFRTLRGFLNGEGPDEANYFRFSATLRIHGDGVPFEEISERLGVEPTHLHINGIQISADGSFVAAWPRPNWDSEGGVVHIFDIRQESPAKVLRHPKPTSWNRHADSYSVTFANDNQRIFTSDQRTIWVWENPAQ